MRLSCDVANPESSGDAPTCARAQSGGRKLQQSAPAGEYVLAIPPALQATMAASLSLAPVLALPASFAPPPALAGYDFVALPSTFAVAPPPSCGPRPCQCMRRLRARPPSCTA